MNGSKTLARTERSNYRLEKDLLMNDPYSNSTRRIDREIIMIRYDLKELRDRIEGRPSWWVTFALGGLMSMVVGMSVYIVTMI